MRVTRAAGRWRSCVCVGVLVDGGSLRSDDVSLAQPDSAEKLDICP